VGEARETPERDPEAVTPSEATEQDGGARRHRVLVAVLVVLGALCILVSTLSIWVRDVALDSDVWADQSGQMLESPEIQQALAAFIVEEAYSAGEVQAQLEAALRPEFKPLAGPASAQLQTVATQAAARALARPRVQELWRTANRAGHEQLVALLEGETERVTLVDDAVVLDLDALVADVATRIGVGEGATQRIQDRVEPIVVMRSDQLESAQQAVKAVKALSIWPFLIGLALWAGAVYLAAGRRRTTLRMIALSLITLGALLLVGRRLGGNAVVDSLVQAESMKPAVRDVWTIFSSLLAESAVAGIVVGLIALASLWLAGPGMRATAVRRWMAPTFRDRPVLVHGALAGAILLVLLWGPVGTPRRLLSLVLITVLAFVGLELLRRQAVREFPDETGGMSLGAALAEVRARSRHSAPVTDDAVARLERLSALHERGALTDDEYEAEKTLLLT
jgi:Short C-terminal domain